ncbi:23S rRNA (adenine(2503)-C(2))-methyltransferase RlmN [Candidatus Nitrospira bockiana]
MPRSSACHSTGFSPPLDLLALDLAGARSLAEAFGWPRYRAVQLLRWLYQKRIRRIEEMTDFSQKERRELATKAAIVRAEDVQVLRSADGTRKFLLGLRDGLRVESVLIPDAGRLTLCLSTQVGCTLDCGFCLTGTMGLKRNLTAAEIVDQVLTVQDRLEEAEQITGLVFMGMGEPLANLAAVREAIRRLSNPEWGLGISPRRMTLSTAGLATRLREIADLGVNLAISLNATTEEQRARLMPAAAKLHDLASLLDACRAYPLPPHRRLTFEYVLLRDVNDTMEDAKRLARLLAGLRCKINLIAFNEFVGSRYRRPDDERVLQFQAVLRRAGFDVFIRKSKGRDVLGACGQLGQPPHARLIGLTPLAGRG